MIVVNAQLISLPGLAPIARMPRSRPARFIGPGLRWSPIASHRIALVRLATCNIGRRVALDGPKRWKSLQRHKGSGRCRAWRHSLAMALHWRQSRRRRPRLG